MQKRIHCYNIHIKCLLYIRFEVLDCSFFSNANFYMYDLNLVKGKKWPSKIGQALELITLTVFHSEELLLHKIKQRIYFAIPSWHCFQQIAIAEISNQPIHVIVNF